MSSRCDRDFDYQGFINSSIHVLCIGSARSMQTTMNLENCVCIGKYAGRNLEEFTSGGVYIGDHAMGTNGVSECIIDVDDVKSITEDPEMAHQFIKYYVLTCRVVSNLFDANCMSPRRRNAMKDAIRTIYDKCMAFIATPAGRLNMPEYYKADGGVYRSLHSFELRCPVRINAWYGLEEW